MKILMLNYEFPPLGGGGGVIFAHIAAELARRHEVDVLTTRHGQLPEFEVVDAMRVYRVAVLGRKEQSTATLSSLLSFPLSSVLKGISLCRQRKYDVMNTHFAVPTGPAGVVLSRLFGIPNVLSIHGGDVYDPSKALSPHRNPVLRKAVEWVLNRSTYILAQSNDTKSRATSYYRVTKDIGIIPWGLKPPHFEETSRAELGLGESDFLIISIGRLVKRKGLDCLLQAVAKTQNPGIRVLLVGEGPEQHHLESLAAALGIGQQVVFLGPVSEESKFQYLSASDLFALPSLHEGFGIVFLEAMHCGLPIITTDHGGQTDFLRDGHNGFLVPVGDADAVADRILALVQNRELRMQMSANNREDVTQYTIAVNAERYEKTFEMAMSARESGDR